MTDVRLDEVQAAAAPTEVVRRLLDALVYFDRQALEGTLADDVVYTNVSLPTIRGRQAVGRALAKLFVRPGVTFEVMLLNVAADGPVVLTERIDVINLGRLRLQFWVNGRFEVLNGEVAVWRDYFDYLDVTRATARAIVGAVVPSLKPRLP